MRPAATAAQNRERGSDVPPSVTPETGSDEYAVTFDSASLFTYQLAARKVADQTNPCLYSCVGGQRTDPRSLH